MSAPLIPSSAGRVALSPAQLHAYERLEETLVASPVAALMGVAGSGKTRIAHALAAAHEGCVIGISEIYQAAHEADPAKWEEAVEAAILAAFAQHRLVIFDDYGIPGAVSMLAGTRGGFFSFITLRHLISTAVARDWRLVLVGPLPSAWQSAADLYGEQAAAVAIPSFTSRDYGVILAEVLGAAKLADVDFRTVFRYASMLNGHQLRLVGRLLARRDRVDADVLINCLQARVLFSNTRTDQVEALSFDTLPGSESIVEELETHLILPFENRALAQKLGLKPKRGVLLYGPPGTGKTSIGRALAHRIKSKFFLIDGSFISEPPNAFFQRIQSTVQEAKDNSPSVLFIDDADVLFGIQHISGLVRYLLSLLDGLESETASNVCVMMTAMDASKIPDALLRSGRVELWLETKAPNLPTRETILKHWMRTHMPGHQHLPYALLAEATEGFTPADLRRVAADAKLLYAADLVAGRESEPAIVYAVRAINEFVTARANMASLLDDPLLRIGHPIEMSPAGKSNDTALVGAQGE